jgi:hypothetical protein
LTWVEFAKSSSGAMKELDRLLSKSRRAWVTLQGVFYGPELQKNVDPKLPQNIRERLEKSPKTYGHLGAFETMIEVTKVSASKVDATGSLVGAVTRSAPDPPPLSAPAP